MPFICREPKIVYCYESCTEYEKKVHLIGDVKNAMATKGKTIKMREKLTIRTQATMTASLKLRARSAGKLMA